MDVTDPLNRAQTVVTGALTKAFESGDTKLVLAAAAGAALVGCIALAYEFGGVAVKAITSGCEAAVESITSSIASFDLGAARKALVTEIKPGDIFPDPYPGLYPET